MKYPTPKHVESALHLLPAFMVLLKKRTVVAAITGMGYSEQDDDMIERFISMVERFIFITINLADPETMDLGMMKCPDPEDYSRRRTEFLKALGLNEYAKTTYLLNPKALNPKARRN